MDRCVPVCKHAYSEDGLGWKSGSVNRLSSSTNCATSSSSVRVLTPGICRMACGLVAHAEKAKKSSSATATARAAFPIQK